MFVNRLYDWAPYMSEDTKWFIWGLYALLRDIFVPLQSDGDMAANVMERYDKNVSVVCNFFFIFLQ